MCIQVFLTSFLFLIYCSFSEVSQVPFFSLYKIASKWYITISNQIASFSLWIPPWYPIIYLNPATSSLEIISDHIDWGRKTKRLPHPYPHIFFRCQSEIEVKICASSWSSVNWGSHNPYLGWINLLTCLMSLRKPVYLFFFNEEYCKEYKQLDEKLNKMKRQWS